MSWLIHWLESHSIPCFYKKYCGIECPGCGVQRAFISLLKGNLGESIKMYPALIPMLLIISFTLIHLGFKFQKGGIYIKWGFIAVSGIVVINYIMKLLM
jgi:hypothetical protein